VSEALGCSHVTKRFGDILANRDVSLSIEKGEIHAVVGENGAGKSTLMRALFGLNPPDEGEVRIGGARVERPSAAASIARGVGMVHQHFMLVPTLTVAENVMLGREVPLAQCEREIAALAEKYRLAIEPGRRVAELSVGEAQRVEIVKVLWRGAEVLILDEPTAVLTPVEVEQLFGVLRELKAAGRTVVLVTHKLDEVRALADRVTVLRRGQTVAAFDAQKTSPAELARAMVGRDVVLELERPPRAVHGDKPRLACEKLTVMRADGSRAVDQVSLAVEAGEILGIAGVEGNGQTELGLALCGLVSSSGAVSIDGLQLGPKNVRERQKLGLGHIPEDRHARGLILEFSVEENLLLGRDAEYTQRGVLDRRALRRDTDELIRDFDVRPPEPTAPARALSGGNQQKIVVGRELGRKLAALVCAQPTRGVDVGAIERIHAELLEARANGVAILLFSAELDELLALADRICVMVRGRFVDEVVNEGERGALKQRLGARMLGAT
jgi:simple sugar transport system ATP-binding protein